MKIGIKKELFFLAFIYVQNVDAIDQQEPLNHKEVLLDRCVRLVAVAFEKGYHYFMKNDACYDLQKDVLDIPYKKMLYDSMCKIDQLFEDANKHDNPTAQIRAIILLCRVQVPAWYSKSFCKGLQTMYALCFDEQGNFVDASSIDDIRMVFKDYCKKSPICWQDIAKISIWSCKNKKPYAQNTSYYALSCTEHNDELLAMLAVNQLQDLVYLKFLLQKNGSQSARKIYDLKN
ncbi:MAG: hypothetical protein ACXWL2_02930 [Candidatus Chromulinivorax sp.]